MYSQLATSKVLENCARMQFSVESMLLHVSIVGRLSLLLWGILVAIVTVAEFLTVCVDIFCTILAPCPCAFQHPMLRGNVFYNGKCFLWYENNVSLNRRSQAESKCEEPDDNDCVDDPKQECINGTGLGRLAAFRTWTDFNAVTSAFNASSFQPIHIALDCDDATHADIDYPEDDCTPYEIDIGSADWPLGVISGDQIFGPCSSSYDYVAIMGPWNSWQTEMSNATQPGYICEIGTCFV